MEGVVSTELKNVGTIVGQWFHYLFYKVGCCVVLEIIAKHICKLLNNVAEKFDSPYSHLEEKCNRVNIKEQSK